MLSKFDGGRRRQASETGCRPQESGSRAQATGDRQQVVPAGNEDCEPCWPARPTTRLAARWSWSPGQPRRGGRSRGGRSWRCRWRRADLPVAAGRAALDGTATTGPERCNSTARPHYVEYPQSPASRKRQSSGVARPLGGDRAIGTGAWGAPTSPPHNRRGDLSPQGTRVRSGHAHWQTIPSSIGTRDGTVAAPAASQPAAWDWAPAEAQKASRTVPVSPAHGPSKKP